MVDRATGKAVQVSYAGGGSPFVLACDHASNRIPQHYGDLGLSATERLSHIAWDPGALAVSMRLSDLLDAPLVFSTISRLIIDPNRVPTSDKAIWTLSETTRIAANEGIDTDERQRRIDTYHRPFHDAVTDVLDKRQARGAEAVFVCIHSFTPTYLGLPRPWQIGVINGQDPRFAEALRDSLAAQLPSVEIGWNKPYSAMSGVTYTMEHHGDERGLPTAMIEIRNNEILVPEGVELWAQRLAKALAAARQAIQSPMHHEAAGAPNHR